MSPPSLSPLSPNTTSESPGIINGRHAAKVKKSDVYLLVGVRVVGEEAARNALVQAQ